MEEARLPYRWPMVVWTLLVGFFIGGFVTGVMPPLFSEIQGDLGLTHTEMGVIWGLAAAGAFVTALAGGMLGDRFGAKKVVAVGVLLSIVFCALRALWPTFGGLAVAMFLLGTALGLITPNTGKIIGMWFGPKELGLALGLLAVGGTMGNVVALMLGVPVSAALGGWKNVMWLSAALSALIFIMWVALARERPLTEAEAKLAAARRSMLSGLKHVLRIRDLWFLCIMQLCVVGAINGFLGHFPQNTADRGMSPAMAGVITGIGAIMVVTFSIVGPVLSDRVGLRKVFIWPVLLINVAFATFLGYAWGVPLIIVVILNGAAIGCTLPLFRAMVIENPTIGIVLAGSALGLLQMANRIGATLVPMVMGAIQDATGEYWQSYLLTAVMCAGAAVLGYLVKETGIRSKKRAEAEEAAKAT